MTKKDKWVKIGVVGVDSGQLMVCDPCYIDGQWESEEFKSGAPAKKSFSYNAVCQAVHEDKMFGQLNFKMGHPGVAVGFNSGIGDGLYPVFARIADVDGWGPRVCEVRIVFDECEIVKKHITPADLNKKAKK